MRKAFFFAVVLAFALAVPVGAVEYTIDAPSAGDFGKPTSIDVVQTAATGMAVNEDCSKNAALIPPAFGSETGNLKGSGEYLTPNLAPGGMATAGATIGSNVTAIPSTGGNQAAVTQFTEVTSDLYYSGGYLGTLKIPAVNLSVKIYQGTGSSTLAKGVGHFTDTSIWDGNVCLAAHNRGTNSYFGQIHTLDTGDKITLTTKLGTRTYKVTSVAKVLETDDSATNPTTEDCLTLYTCVRDQSAYRWCVRAVAV
ncbi:Sortase domain protein [anaerobic digester metagenome]